MTEVFCLGYILKLINAHTIGDGATIYKIDFKCFSFHL
jgi:hypothetical protein